MLEQGPPPVEVPGLSLLFIHQMTPAAVLGKPSRMEPDGKGEGEAFGRRQGPSLLWEWRGPAGRPIGTTACNLKLSRGDPCKDHPVIPLRGSFQSRPSLGVHGNGPFDPLIQIPRAPGLLRGWSGSVGGCPLAERRATTHPPDSCNPKGEGIKSRGTM